MKKIFAVNGSPRSAGNTSYLLKSFLSGVETTASSIYETDAHKVDLEYCNGCLRCNLIKRCSISNDEWPELSKQILEANVLVFASPVYFHHLTAPVKKIIDRFRSFVNVNITEESLEHSPWQEWDKDFVLLLSMGSSDDKDAKPIIDLFEYMVKMLGSKNKLHVITASRLAVIRQISMDTTDLSVLYSKLGLNTALSETDAETNQQILEKCFNLGKTICS